MPPTHSTASSSRVHKPSPSLSVMVRMAWTGGGLLFLALGVVGIYLPGIPTTGPLILAAFLFGKGNPHLRQQMLDARLLAPYRGYLDGSKPMSWTVCCWALACMWTSIALSCWLLSHATQVTAVALPACMLGGVAGTVCILWYRAQTGRAVNYSRV